MKTSFFKSIGGKLLVYFLLIALIPLISGGLVTKYMLEQKMTDKSQQNMLNSVKLTSSAIDNWVEGKFASLEALSADPVFQSGDKTAIEAKLKAVLDINPEAEMIFWAGPDGTSWTSHGLVTNVGERDYFKPVMSGKKVVSNLMISKTTNNKIVVIAVPVKGPSGVNGLVAGTFVPQTLYSLIAQTKYGQTGYGFMVDSTGMFMAHPDEKLVMNSNITKMDSESMNRAGKEMLEKKEGTAEYNLGEDKLVAYVPVKNSGWLVAVTAPISEVYDLTTEVNKITMIVILIAFVIIVPLSLFISKQISRPIITLAQQADVLATGNLRANNKTAYDGELGILGSSLNVMAGNIYGVISSLIEAIDNLENSTREISVAADNTAQISQQVTETINQISVGAQETAGNINNITEAQKGISKEVTLLASNVDGIAETTNETVNYTKQGERIMNDLSNVIKESNTNSQMVQNVMVSLSQQAKEISGITNIITNIAEQTNLLALNAAIEAARAGDAGRGFAVVADEVRKLAEAASAQANQITNLINQITKDVDAAVKVTLETAKMVERQANIGSEAENQFIQIAEGTNKVAQLLNEIGRQTNSIEKQVQSLGTGMENIAAISQENAASTEEIAASSEEMTAATQTVNTNVQGLLGLMDKLRKESQRFTL